MFRKISTHTPHAGRDTGVAPMSYDDAISTHTPHAGRDNNIRNNMVALEISTHTPHAGRDNNLMMENTRQAHFYSHAPCGARQYFDDGEYPSGAFLLTRPMRGATKELFDSFTVIDISTHTPHAGRDDEQKRAHAETNRNFYSHAPCGARRTVSKKDTKHQVFLLTRPMRGATVMPMYSIPGLPFLLTRPMRGATDLCAGQRQR